MQRTHHDRLFFLFVFQSYQKYPSCFLPNLRRLIPLTMSLPSRRHNNALTRCFLFACRITHTHTHTHTSLSVSVSVCLSVSASVSVCLCLCLCLSLSLSLSLSRTWVCVRVWMTVVECAWGWEWERETETERICQCLRLCSVCKTNEEWAGLAKR